MMDAKADYKLLASSLRRVISSEQTVLHDAADTLLAAESQIAERDAQIAEIREATYGIATFVEEQIVHKIGEVEACRVRLLIESRTGFEPRKNPGPQPAELGLEANNGDS